MTSSADAITVLILSWNRPIFLWMCLDSLYRYTRHAARFILVDNNSDDPAVAKIIEGFERRGMFELVVWAKSNSPTRAFEAMHKYRDLYGDYFIFIESDTAVFDTNPCWLTQLSELMNENPKMAMLGSYIDTRDFIDPYLAYQVAPYLDDRQRDGLIKAHSPERLLPVDPPAAEIIEPFNPPGRLLALRTCLLDTVQLGPDGFLYQQVKAAGFEAGIATGVRHRHLSLLNFFDYPEYDIQARDRFFDYGVGYKQKSKEIK